MKEIIGKLDAIEAANVEKIAEVTTQVKTEIETVKGELTEQVAALEAKISTLAAPQIIKPIAKTVRQDVNLSVS